MITFSLTIIYRNLLKRKCQINILINLMIILTKQPSLIKIKALTSHFFLIIFLRKLAHKNKFQETLLRYLSISRLIRL